MGYFGETPFSLLLQVFGSPYGRGFGLVAPLLGEEHPLNQPNSVYGVIFYSTILLMAFMSHAVVAKLQVNIQMHSNDCLSIFCLADILWLHCTGCCTLLETRLTPSLGAPLSRVPGRFGLPGLHSLLRPEGALPSLHLYLPRQLHPVRCEVRSDGNAARNVFNLKLEQLPRDVSMPVKLWHEPDYSLLKVLAGDPKLQLFPAKLYAEPEQELALQGSPFQLVQAERGPRQPGGQV